MATEYGVSLAYISDITTEGQRTNAVGKVGAASSIGMIIGPALGGLLNIYGNFWSPGLAAVGLTALNLIFIYFLLPETVKKNSNDSVENPLKESTGILRRALSYIRNPMTGMVLGITFIMAFAFSSLPVVLPLISSQLFGFGETEVGIFFAYIGIIGFIIQVEIIAKVSKRMSDEMIIILGLLLTIIGVILIPILPYLPVFLIGISIAAFGIFFADIAIPSFLSKKTPSSEYGSILGVTESFSSIARVPGPLIAGFAYQLAIFSPFYISTIMLIIALGLGIKTNNYNKNYKINH
jgi:predicted MFS family arabinose efflux permease